MAENSQGRDDNVELIKWDSKFELGINRIDIQHETLVKLCNDLYAALIRNKDNESWHEDVKESLRVCATYTQTHFKDEEKLMEACGFSGLEHHRTEHVEFTKKVFNLVSSFDYMTYMDAIKFSKFLYEWILSHIAHEDRLYVKKLTEYLHEQKKN